MEHKIVVEQDLSPAAREIIKSLVIEGVKEVLTAQLGEKFLSPAEACKLFNPAVSVKTLTRWTKDGLIPDHRIGGRIYYKYGEVMAAGKTLKRYKPR